MFKIGDFSKLSRISIRMLRHYAEMELLLPEQVDPFTGYRYYSAKQLALASRIQSLKAMGFSLASIREILKQYEDQESLKNYLKIRYLQIQEESSLLHSQMNQLENAIKRMEKGEQKMNYDVLLKEQPKRTMMCLRGKLPNYRDEGELWKQLYLKIGSLKIQFPEPQYRATVYFDEGYQEHDVDVEVRTEVIGTYPDTDGIRFCDVPAATVAAVIVKGNFDQMPEACEALANWISDNHYEISGKLTILYHVGPSEDQNPKNWVTEICFPVSKK